MLASRADAPIMTITMRVTVHYLAQMKRAAGCATEAVEITDGASVQNLLALLSDKHGSALRTLLLDDAKRPLKSLLLFIGDEHARCEQPLRHDDVVTILTPMSGG